MRERNPLEIIEQRQTDSFEHWLRIGQSPLALCRDHPEAEYVETKARFLAVTAGAGEWATIHRELGDLKVRRVYRVAARQAPHAAGPRQHGEGNP